MCGLPGTGKACASILIIFDCVALEACITLTGGVLAKATDVCVRCGVWGIKLY